MTPQIRLLIFGLQAAAIIAVQLAILLKRSQVRPEGSKVKDLQGTPVVRLDGEPVKRFKRIHKKEYMPWAPAPRTHDGSGLPRPQ